VGGGPSRHGIPRPLQRAWPTLSKATTNLLANASVSDDVVYAVTKAIMENTDKLPKVHVALSQFDPRRAADPLLNGNCPLHPGRRDTTKRRGSRNESLLLVIPEAEPKTRLQRN
jgi:TRAP-type uncharacterized transport system substrate-binding protein